MSQPVPAGTPLVFHDDILAQWMATTPPPSDRDRMVMLFMQQQRDTQYLSDQVSQLAAIVKAQATLNSAAQPPITPAPVATKPPAT